MAKYTQTRTHRSKEEGIVKATTTRCNPFLQRRRHN